MNSREDPRGAGLAPAPRLRGGAGRDGRLVPRPTAPGRSACAAAPTATTTSVSIGGAWRLGAMDERRTYGDRRKDINELRGVVLAGGTGSRLFPLTKVTNKHLLPVGAEPMIFHPIKKLIEAGIREILIVTGTEHMGDVVGLLGSGKDFGCEFTYRVQDEAGGIAQALGLAERFGRGGRLAVILGDNIFEELDRPVRRRLSPADQRRQGAAPGGPRSRALRRRRSPKGERVVQHRREAERSAQPPRRHRHLLLRRERLRGDRHAQAVRARRAGDHRRQQRLHRARRSHASTCCPAGGPTPAPSSR